MSKMKPYQLVRVNRGDYEHYAEVISYPITGHGTIMVRAVPGDPTSLVELRMATISSVPQGRRRYVHHAEVRHVAAGAFPVDMLRREMAAPVNFDPETGLLTEEPGTKPLLIGKLTESKNPHWNFERWLSFGWELIHLDTRQFKAGES